MVLDLDETLVHSSLKVRVPPLKRSISHANVHAPQAVPSPDYIVPVEIEAYWHNFYVLKRPGVDEFLRKMGEIYEVVVFTASLSKVRGRMFTALRTQKNIGFNSSFGSMRIQSSIDLILLIPWLIGCSEKAVTITRGTTSRYVPLQMSVYLLKRVSR